MGLLTLCLEFISITKDQWVVEEDDNGNPVPQSLWEFEMELKNDPRWMETNDAQNSITGSLNNIAKMMGGLG